MIIKLESGKLDEHQEVYLLEATMSGVTINRWSSHRKDYGEFYERIVFRHIKFYRTEEEQILFGKFL
jgi:hypothetical protein